MNKREERQARRDRVQREFRVAVVAMAALDRQLTQDPSVLGTHALRQSDLENLRRNLEDTFFIRLFAEFEAGLRDVWKHTVRDTNPKTVELLGALGTRRRVDEDVLREAQAAREYRNSLVHEEAEEAPRVSFAAAHRTFRRFFARMPPDW